MLKCYALVRPLMVVASLVACGLLSLPCWGATKPIRDYVPTVWRQSEGIPSNSLRALLQTSDGYLWVGTKGGLARFNGVEFETFSALTPGQLVESEVRALLEGSDGSLYIGTQGGGLNILKDGKFTALRKKEGLAHDIVRALCRGDDGAIWIGTDGGLTRLREGQLKTLQVDSGLPPPKVSALIKGPNGRIWVGTRKGLYLVVGDTLTRRADLSPLGKQHITAMALGAERQLWVGTSDGLLLHGDGDFFRQIPPTLTPKSPLWALHTDSLGHLWMGNRDSVFRLADGKLQRYPAFIGSQTTTRFVDVTPVSHIWAITSDSEGNLWLGSSESGLLQLRPGTFHSLTEEDGLPSSWVEALHETPTGELYAGTLGGVAVIRDDRVERLPLSRDGGSCEAWTLAQSNDGVMWVGSSCGVFFSSQGRFEPYPIPARKGEYIDTMMVSRDGTLWIGYAKSGLLRITPEGARRAFTTEDGLLGDKIRSIAEDRDGTLWVTTLAGNLNHIRGDQVTTPELNGIGQMGPTYYILSASDGGIWFATRSGLVRYKDGLFTKLPSGRGMPEVEFFYQLVEDSLGYLWMTSSVGLHRASLAELNALADGGGKRAHFDRFTNEDGMPSAASSLRIRDAAIRCRGQLLCFGTQGGIAIVDPKAIAPDSFVPPIHIERVLFDGDAIAMEPGVELGPGENDVEFTYAGLEFTFPHRMQFRHRLSGSETHWSAPSARRTATYTNLSPGPYRFEVMASNSDGVWNPAAASFDFRIAPRFYQTNSFYVLSALTLLSLALGVVRLRTRRLRLQAEHLEKTVQARTEAISQRNEDMRRVLNNVNQGFLTVDAKGILADEHSAIVDRWFGGYGPGASLVTFMSGIDPDFASSFRHGFEVLASDVLPHQLAVAQLPKRIQCDEKQYSCSYTTLLEQQQVKGLLIVVSDVSSELLHARQEAERAELLSMFESLTRDRTGVLNFFDNGTDGLERLPRADTDEQKESLHSLKGNAGLLGLDVVAGICHQLEEQLEERGEPLADIQFDVLRLRWRALKEGLHSFLGEKGRDVVELHLQDMKRLAAEVQAGAPQAAVLDTLASWWLEDVKRPLSRLARYAQALAARLGKGQLQIEIESHGLRLNPKVWGGLWTELVHVIRNAVDHGLEPPHERRKSGKSEAPRLRLSAGVSGQHLVVEIEDNGRGIDWTAVHEVAGRRGLPSQSQDDLVDCLFSSGLTTRDKATLTSGRGIGLATLRRLVDEADGHISVTSRLHEGSCFRFEFPLPQIAARFGVDPGKAPEEPKLSNPASSLSRRTGDDPSADRTLS